MYDNFGKFPKKYVILRITNFIRIMFQIDFKTYIPNLDDAISFYKEIEGNPQDNALTKLFKQLCPNNTDIDDIMIKCSALNDFYSTNIFNVTRVAEHIFQKDIDARLAMGDPTLVEEIGRISEKKYFYSFATKYCAFHQPALYNIYDSHVHNILMHFGKRDKYAHHTHKSLRDYPCFKEAVSQFQKHYHLESLSAWELDKYMWMLGKIK